MRKILFMLAAIMFAACGDVDLGLTHKIELKNPYAVTPDEAVQLLQTVIGGESTRSISVSDIKTLSKSDFVPTTRSASDGEVIYIVDIEDGGSAILGADKRMEPIYAVFDSAKISIEDLLGATTRSSTEDESVKDYMFGLLSNAISNDIQEMGQRGVEMPLVPRDQTWRDTTLIARKEPLLRTEWDQNSPFNDNYDEVPGTTKKFLAGCGPIAVAQILYYNRFPSLINGVAFDWDLIEEYEIGNDSPSQSATTEVANFVYQVKVGTNATPTGGSGGMSVNIGDVRTFLSNIGYINPTFKRTP